MYIRLTRARFDPAQVDVVARTTREQVIPAAGRLSGIQSFQVALDREAGRLIAVSSWDSPAHAEVIGALRAVVEAVGVEFEDPELYEVVATL